MIIALSGYGYTDCGCVASMGTGKDTVAEILEKHRQFVRVGFADPIKRFVKDLFDFSDAQVWGPSEERNKPDRRYIRQLGPSPSEDLCLTPRFAMQSLGNDWGRDTIHKDTWVKYAIRVAKIIEGGEHHYDAKDGLRHVPVQHQLWKLRKNVVFSDLRYKNEFNQIWEGGGFTVRIKRKVKFIEAMNHPSEQGLINVDDSEFDYVLDNDGTIESLKTKTLEMVDYLSSR